MKSKLTIRLFILLVVASHLWSCENRQSDNILSEEESRLFSLAVKNGLLANEGYLRCAKYVDAWLGHADPGSGLIPRNLESSLDIWNAKDAAADNYPFMVLTAFFVDQEMFEGRMQDMLDKEKQLTSRIGSLPDTYSFSKKGFLNDDVRIGEIMLGASEYIKDGLLPLTEWLGESPWSDRMMEMLHDLNNEMTIAGDMDDPAFGNAPREEVNGELLQVLSRIYWMSGEEKFLNWAMKIGDFYLLQDNHPTRDLEYLRLRDHGCELVSGLCELYVTTHFARPDKNLEYREPMYEMLDRILEVGRNEYGFFYDGINPQSGEIVHERLADTWGYTLNGFYTIFMVDGKTEYKEAVAHLFYNLNKYRNHDWEGNADGYADAIESALNLFNRLPEPEVSRWIDSEIQVMWGMQQDNGIIEGWHGDGNFARTTIMYNLWKSKGSYVKPWRTDLCLGAEIKGDSLFVSISSEQVWQGKLFFDFQRHKENMKLPVDWPRINQFPEWFVAMKNQKYHILDVDQNSIVTSDGIELIRGMDMELQGEKKLIIYPVPEAMNHAQ